MQRGALKTNTMGVNQAAANSFRWATFATPKRHLAIGLVPLPQLRRIASQLSLKQRSALKTYTISVKQAAANSIRRATFATNKRQFAIRPVPLPPPLLIQLREVPGSQLS